MNALPFNHVWWGVDIPNYRECGRTYGYLKLDTLPPILASELDGSYSWLYETPLRPRSKCDDSDDREFAAKFDALQSQARELGLSLPDSYISFMSQPELRDRVLALTGSFWKIDTLEPCPASNGYLSLGRSDSQAVLLWYLYLDTDTHEHCVLVSPDYYGSDAAAYAEQDAENPEDIDLCAWSFEEFVYREWIEHSAAGKMLMAQPLSEREQAYVDHYRPPGDSYDRRPRCQIHGCLLKPGEMLRLGMNCPCIDWKGSYPDGLGVLRRASLFSVCGWKKDESVSVVSEQAYCPWCRTGMLAALRERGSTALVDLLHQRLPADQLSSAADAAPA